MATQPSLPTTSRTPRSRLRRLRHWRLRVGAVLVIASTLSAGFLLLYFPVKTAAVANPSPSASRMSTSTRWKIAGLRTSGGSESAKWSVRAREAQIVGTPIGPFRFQPMKTLEVVGLHLEIVEWAANDDPVSNLQQGVADLMASIAAGDKVSKVSVHDLHLDIRDKDGRLTCCVSAGDANWSLREGARSSVQLSGIVNVGPAPDSWTTDRANFPTSAPSLVASHWDHGRHGVTPLHPGEETTRGCSLLIADSTRKT